MGSLLSINVGTREDWSWAGLGYSSIRKHSVAGPVGVHELGVDGDQISDTRFHGGIDQAVYAFAREDLDEWAVALGREIPNGLFGENLTTVGLDVNQAEVGEHWQIGTTTFEVAAVRIPCNDFKGWMGESGFDNTAWVKRFTQRARPGPYLRVVQPGTIEAGQSIEVVHRPGHGITATMMFQAHTTHHELLPRLLEIDNLAAVSRLKAEDYVARQS